VPQILPDELQLQLAPGEARQFTVQAGEDCEVQWEINQLASGTRQLPAGQTLTITFALPAAAGPRSLIRGRVLIIRLADKALVRSIPVAGWVRKAQAAEKPATEPTPRPPNWLKGLLLSLLAVGAAAIGVSHFFRPPALIVKPARMDLGTIWYSPPVGGFVETSLVFTVQWRALPRNAENLSLVARKNVHCISDTGQEIFQDELTNFPLTREISEVSIPLTFYNLTNDNARVSGTISLTVSNAQLRVLPDQIRFEAELKPAAP
jgi:hypothetical protein